MPSAGRGGEGALVPLDAEPLQPLEDGPLPPVRRPGHVGHSQLVVGVDKVHVPENVDVAAGDRGLRAPLVDLGAPPDAKLVQAHVAVNAREGSELLGVVLDLAGEQAQFEQDVHGPEAQRPARARAAHDVLEVFHVLQHERAEVLACEDLAEPVARGPRGGGYVAQLGAPGEWRHPWRAWQVQHTRRAFPGPGAAPPGKLGSDRSVAPAGWRRHRNGWLVGYHPLKNRNR